MKHQPKIILVTWLLLSILGGSLTIASAAQKPKIAKKTTLARKIIVRLESPRSNFVTTEASVAFSGTARQDMLLTINHLPIYVDDHNRFRVEVPLIIGKNLIRIEGEYKGKKFVGERKILRRPKFALSDEEALKIQKKEIFQKEKELYERALKISQAESKAGLTEEEVRDLEEQKYKLVEDKKKIDEAKEKLRVQESAEVLSTLGMLEVKPEKKIQLDEYVLRAELAIILVKAKDLPLEDVYQDVFADVPRDHWAAAYIKTVVDVGLMKPYPDGTFKPIGMISQREAKEIISKLQAL